MGGFQLPPGWTAEPSEAERGAGGSTGAFALPAGWTTEPEEEEQFPTPMETAGTMVSSGLRSIPGMVAGGLKMASDPFTMPARELGAMVGIGDSPGRTQAEESLGHLKAAAALEARDPKALEHVVSAIPVAGPMAVGLVKGAGKILSPAYTSATEGVGKITPQEMREAAESGGPAVAGLALPGAVKGASKVAAKITPATAGKVLRFAVTGGVEAPLQWVAKRAIGDFVVKPAMRKLGTIAQDAILDAIRSGDVVKAAETIAKAVEKSPTAAQALAETFLETEARGAGTVAPTGQGGGQTPYAGPYTGTWDVPGRTAPAPVSPPAPPALSANAQRLAGLPAKGQSRIPTIFTKPPPKSPAKPKTPKQRELEIEQVQAALEAGIDIWEAFGMHGMKPK